MFLVGRLINGFGIGALVSTIPMYQAEVSTPESRGFMVSMHVCVHPFESIGQATDATIQGSHVRYGLHSVRLDWVWHVLHHCWWLDFLLPLEVPDRLPNGASTLTFGWISLATLQPALVDAEKPERGSSRCLVETSQNEE